MSEGGEKTEHSALKEEKREKEKGKWEISLSTTLI